MSKLRHVTQMELENFASQLSKDDEAAGGKALSAQDVRIRSLAARQALADKLQAGQELPTWADAYHRLLNAGWPWRIAAFVSWASMPKPMRWPDTQEKLAVEVLGLTSDRQIATWRRKNPALDQLIADLQADELLEARADVFGALKQSASTPDYKHAPDRRMYLEMSGDLVSRLSVNVNESASHSLLNMTDAELLALAGDKAKELLLRMRQEAQDAQEADQDASDSK